MCAATRQTICRTGKRAQQMVCQLLSVWISGYQKNSPFVLDVDARTIIVVAVPYRYGARRRWSRGVERDAEVRKLCRPRHLRGSVVREGGRGDHGRGRGRLECMSGRQLARTGGRWRNSHPWDIQQADKSIRVRNAGEKLLPRPRFSLTPSHVGLNHRPCAVNFSNGAWDARLASGRPRKRFFAKRSAPPLLGEKEQEEDGLLCGRHEHGAMMHVYRWANSEWRTANSGTERAVNIPFAIRYSPFAIRQTCGKSC